MVIAVDAYKIAYMALPKAGCSSVKEALARINPDIVVPPEDQITLFTWHELCPTRRFRVRRWKRYADHWRFCVIRDPVKRLLSVYSDIVLGRDGLKNSPNVRDSRTLTTQPDPDFFFTHLDAYRAASSNVRHHAFSASIFLGFDLSAYHRVYRTSEMHLLAEALGARARCLVEMPHSNASRQTLTLDDLKPATIDMIRPFLNAEYDLLSGYYDNPMGRARHDACAMPRCDVS